MDPIEIIKFNRTGNIGSFKANEKALIRVTGPAGHFCFNKAAENLIKLGQNGFDIGKKGNLIFLITNYASQSTFTAHPSKTEMRLTSKELLVFLNKHLENIDFTGKSWIEINATGEDGYFHLETYKKPL
jgi:hypothetical protein